MKISIITVVYNGEETIEDTILSVANQKHSDVEHIIIDGGSTDKTMGIVYRHEDKLSIIISEPDNGLYDAMNKGIQLTKGDVIGTLNSDDLYENQGVLEKVAHAFQDPSIDVCFSDLKYVSQDLSKTIRFWKSSNYQKGLFATGWIPPHPTFFARRSVYTKCGGFNLDYKLAADYELMLRFLHRNEISSYYIPEVFVNMRVGGETNKSLLNIMKGNIEIYQANKLHGLHIGVFFFILKAFNRMKQYFVRSKC